mgnify:FL=1
MASSQNSNHNGTIKIAALERLGGAKCVMCGCEVHKFLTIDHINGDGAAHRKAIKKTSGYHTYRWVLNVSDEELEYIKLRVLCFNCNCSKLPDSELHIAVDGERRRIMSDERYG